MGFCKAMELYNTRMGANNTSRGSNCGSESNCFRYIISGPAEPIRQFQLASASPV